ncbi:hypothetical protein GF380_01835 [Candidatus Uhrbacteria bacterium]|nr:hypothetical protein [Candidatus Uhrbacteria bacterium]
MAYGPLRLLASNKITSATMLTVSSQATGDTSGVVKSGSGVASMSVAGDFAAAVNLRYRLNIDDVSSGKEVGQATFRWRTDQTTSGTWEESAVTTVQTPAYALSADGRGGGLSVSWTGGVGDDFEEDDDFYFVAKAQYGPGKMLDRDRQTYWKSTGVDDETIVIDLGSAQSITAAILHDHNLTDSATVKIQGHTADSWASPAFSYTFTSIVDLLSHYFSQSYRYWRFYIDDPTNTDGYIQVGNIGLFAYTQLEAENAEWGSVEVASLKAQQNESEVGVQRDYYYAQQRQWNLNFPEVLSNNDVDTLIGVQENLIDATTKQISPLWVHLFSDETEKIRLMRWQNIGEFQRVFRAYLLNSGVSMTFAEVVKT